MAARYCIECGSPVSTAFCPSCGALQPTGVAAESTGTPPRDPADPWSNTGQWSEEPTGTWPSAADRQWSAEPTRQIHQWPAAPTPAPQDPSAAQPWHPFEQPSWSSGFAEPDPAPSAPPPADSTSFMGVSSWQTVPAAPPPPSPDQRRNWILGILAAAAVVAVLVAVAVVFFKGTETATPEVLPAPATSSNTATLSTSSSPGPTPTPTSSPSVTTEQTTQVQTTEVPTSAETVSSEPVTSAEPTSASVAVEPPVQEIACAPGFIVQIASAADDAGMVERVASLRAAGQLPANVLIAHTGQSCQIWTGSSNSVVLYAGPFADPAQGCDARAAGAPDSFIRGTTPETATQISYCVCLTNPSLLPTIDQVGQANVWVGELQRFWVNKISYPDKYRLPELNDANWGVYTTETADAVKQFQQLNGIEQSGRVDARTWQALQANGCV